MRRVFIIHGWEGTPESNWFPWLKKELEQRGYKVFVPQLPNPMTPDSNSWLSSLKQLVRNPDEDTIFVGHSLGCIAILRFLENIDTKVGAVILVAGFGKKLEYEGYRGEVDGFFDKLINWKKIKNSSNKFVTFHSKNDPFVDICNSNLFKEKLNAQSIVHEDMSHYNEGAGITKFPDLLNIILKL